VLRRQCIAVSVQRWVVGCASPGEELAQVGEGFKLECVAGWVQEEHRGLLTNLAFETSVGLDDEVHASYTNALGKLLPLGLRENDAEVRYRYIVAINSVAVELSPVAGRSAWFVVRDDLMTKEIEIDPVFRATALWTPENRAVEVPRCIEVVNRKGDMKRTPQHA
jgi:hypothetical protein